MGAGEALSTLRDRDLIIKNRYQIEFDDVPIALKLATQGDGLSLSWGDACQKLADVYRRHGGDLLEGNVRSFLTLKSSVNRDIRGTILREPEHFFIYNNGIAVTAQDLVFNSHGDGFGRRTFKLLMVGRQRHHWRRQCIGMRQM